MYIHIKRSEKSYAKLLKYLLAFDIISFDIFDTTIIRICESPEDVFNIVATKAKEFGIDNFLEIRLNAQKSAEAENGVQTNLSDIYEKIQEICDLPERQVNCLKSYEVKIEADLCIPNATIVSIINDLIKNNKKVIFTSDMYLDSTMIKEIFKRLGIQIAYDEMFISCEIGKSKSVGDLFEYIKEYYNDKEIVHVGDYWRSDIYNALKSKNIEAVYYPLAGKNKGKYDLFLKNSVSIKESYIYKWAYCEFAPVLWNFCEWIYTEAKNDHVGKLLFLTREGAFIEQLFEIYNKDKEINSYILYASRRSLLCASSDINWSWIAQTFGNASVEFLLDAFHIDKSDFNNEILSKMVKRWQGLEQIKDDMGKYSVSQRKFFISYIDKMISGQSKIGLIDVGWKGSSQFFLEKIFEKEGRDTSVLGYYLGEFYDERHKDLNKKGFLCSSEDVQYKEAVLNAGFIFENVLSSEFGSTKEYEIANDEVTPVLESIGNMNGNEIKIAQKAVIKYFEKYQGISNHTVHPSREASISMLFKQLENPTYKMAEKLGDISYVDFGKTRYVASPNSFFHYICKPKDFVYDFKHCGWNSAFCRRCFKLPLPYFYIYKYLRRIFCREN